MKVYIGSDHRGFELKEELVPWLENQGHEVVDVGAKDLVDGDDYPDYGITVAESVADEPEARRGIVLCGSGVGMVVSANKVKGVRAALMHDASFAETARNDDNVNVMAIGADYTDIEQIKPVVQSFLTSDFSAADRHQRRIEKIEAYERNN